VAPVELIRALGIGVAGVGAHHPRPVALGQARGGVGGGARMHADRLPRMPSIAVVGGGFGGVCAVVMLRRAGYDDVTVFERGERAGGVWHHNTSPGAACDVPSHLYEFSFAPNPHWSRRYAPRAEIQAYLEDVARSHGVLDRIRTGVEVTSARW